MPDFIIFNQILRIFHQSRVNRPESFELEAPVAPRAVITLIRKIDDKNRLPEHFNWDKNHKRQDIKNPPALTDSFGRNEKSLNNPSYKFHSLWIIGSIILIGKNAWFFEFERFWQSFVFKEWSSFNERLRIVCMKDCRIL